MKIDSSTFKAAPLPNTPAAPKPVAPQLAIDAVNLSEVGQIAQSGGRPPVDSARIQEIKNAIAQGRFQINPEAIADGLIETARELINSQRQA